MTEFIWENQVDPNLKSFNEADYISTEVTAKSTTIINSRFWWLNFDNDININQFNKNLNIFFEILTKIKINNKNELDEIINLNAQINTYIKINQESIRRIKPSKLMWIKIEFMRLNEIIEKRISFISFLWANEINAIQKKIKKSFSDTYYLFIPPNYLELPKEITTLKIINQLENNPEILINSERFRETFNNLKDICGKLIHNKENTLSNLNISQLNEMLACLEILTKQIELALSKINEKWIWKDNEMNLKVLNNLFLLKAKNKIKKYVANISINNYYKLLNNKYQDNKKIDQLCTDNNTFSEFKNEFSEFQQQLLINKWLLNEINEKSLDELKNTLWILINILKKAIEVNESKWLTWKKILYNASLMMNFIISFTSENKLVK